ncbi:hypothetical protein KRR38_05965 [Novosphingobium sp. G106]|uniref:hypothetical protein n=1 Tax=Novosphingobium sp. G106 TaxID=2849500 RepID=UPI001C2D5A7C|nr:hypothetical protein [Novosphingobium sp. G106]MBV1687229.1 hypothetical protein [Novosphingobium sp. G106]
MRKTLLASMLVILPVGLHAAEPERAGTLPGPVSYEVRSWGRVILHWQVNPDGTGEIWKLAEQKDKGQLRKFRLRLAGHGMNAFVTNIEGVRAANEKGIRCDKEIFDLPYGSVTWDYPDAKQTYSFDAGCRSEEADEAAEILGAASTIIETMAKVDSDPYVVEPV